MTHWHNLVQNKDDLPETPGWYIVVYVENPVNVRKSKKLDRYFIISALYAPNEKSWYKFEAKDSLIGFEGVINANAEAELIKMKRDSVLLWTEYPELDRKYSASMFG